MTEATGMVQDADTTINAITSVIMIMVIVIVTTIETDIVTTGIVIVATMLLMIATGIDMNIAEIVIGTDSMIHEIEETVAEMVIAETEIVDVDKLF